jgi:hypothetical protein
VLDAIAMAFGGRDQIPAEPIRRGVDRAEVVVDLGEILVRRTFTAVGGGQLVVSNREGARFQSPQSMLDALVGRLSFDPLAFAREKPARQAEILRELVGLDLAPLDARRAVVYAERTAVNKRAASLLLCAVAGMGLLQSARTAQRGCASTPYHAAGATCEPPVASLPRGESLSDSSGWVQVEVSDFRIRFQHRALASPYQRAAPRESPWRCEGLASLAWNRWLERIVRRRLQRSWPRCPRRPAIPFSTASGARSLAPARLLTMHTRLSVSACVRESRSSRFC